MKKDAILNAETKFNYLKNFLISIKCWDNIGFQMQSGKRVINRIDYFIRQDTICKVLKISPKTFKLWKVKYYLSNPDCHMPNSEKYFSSYDLLRLLSRKAYTVTKFEEKLPEHIYDLARHNI